MKAHEFKATEIRAEGPSLSPDFVRQVLERKVARDKANDAQSDESMQHMTREDLVEIVRELRVQLRVSAERNLEMAAAIRDLNRRVFP
jgi:hypothetical protein